jgi:tetratricopeptide (TPR) repeat protein
VVRRLDCRSHTGTGAPLTVLSARETSTLKVRRKSLCMDGRNLWALAAALLFMATGMPYAAPVFAETPSEGADREMEAGHFQAACQLYRLALATHRSDVSILIKAARAYEAAGDLDEAIHRAREATVFEPTNAGARVALGHFLDANREDKAAILQFEMALQIKDAEPETRKAAYGPLLRLLRHQNQCEKLEKTARRGVHDFPQDADCHYNLGWALSQLPKTDAKASAKLQAEAISEYRRSISLGGKRAGAHLNLALLLADSGDKNAASQELSTYLKLAPGDADRSEVVAVKRMIESESTGKTDSESQ